jgi:uncharacterized protein (TIGR02757 family)
LISADNLLNLLEAKYLQYNNQAFIGHDPISIPHQFSLQQDIEIMGFWAAILAWGQRKTIINKCNELVNLMDGQPFEFIKNHQPTDLKPFLTFKHRTFNDIDTLYFISFFHDFYKKNDSLESAFLFDYENEESVENGLINFHKKFFSLEYAPYRTQKHISTPSNNSACKRINMFLRWMVRKDANGVDFGLWHKIKPNQLICPCDVHVDRVARALGLIHRKQTDWKTALELTDNLKKFDANDPVKYDFALFGMGAERIM